MGSDRQKSLGSEIVESLTELRDTLRSGNAISKKFTVRKVELDLRPNDYDAEAVRRTRDSLGVSQAVFAQILAVSPATIESWEQGVRKPAPTARRLLDVINREKRQWIRLLKNSNKTIVSR